MNAGPCFEIQVNLDGVWVTAGRAARNSMTYAAIRRVAKKYPFPTEIRVVPYGAVEIAEYIDREKMGV